MFKWQDFVDYTMTEKSDGLIIGVLLFAGLYFLLQMIRWAVCF